MLRSWSEPFREAHGHRPDVRWYELSLVESAVGPLWHTHIPSSDLQGMTYATIWLLMTHHECHLPAAC